MNIKDHHQRHVHSLAMKLVTEFQAIKPTQFG
jgi:hypothetical protein